MRYYFGVAKEEGMSDDEIGAVQSVVMAVSAARVNAQFREARIDGKKEKRKRSTGPCEAAGPRPPTPLRRG